MGSKTSNKTVSNPAAKANTQVLRVAHILVKHEYETQDLLRRLEDGEGFAELAQKYSLCSSARQGGDLGVLRKGRTVEEFEEVAFSLQIGQVSQPVRTRFGFHLIKRLPTGD